jgi:hypothetical protein
VEKASSGINKPLLAFLYTITKKGKEGCCAKKWLILHDFRDMIVATREKGTEHGALFALF